MHACLSRSGAPGQGPTFRWDATPHSHYAKGGFRAATRRPRLATSNPVTPVTRVTAMFHAEQVVDGFRVFASAVECEGDRGYRSAAVVLRLGGHGLPVEVVFRDDSLDDGRQWTDAGAAVRFGLEVGEAAAKSQRVLSSLARTNSMDAAPPACRATKS